MMNAINSRLIFNTVAKKILYRLANPPPTTPPPTPRSLIAPDARVRASCSHMLIVRIVLHNYCNKIIVMEQACGRCYLLRN